MKQRLRPHWLWLDLLMGAVALFAFQLGPNAEEFLKHDVQVPEADSDDPSNTIPVTPECCWHYRTLEGHLFSATEMAREAHAHALTIVLLMSPDTDLQDFLDAEQPLARLGVNVGLAVVGGEE